MKLELGISSWTFPWAVGVQGFLPKEPLDAMGLMLIAKKMGVSRVQIADNLPLHNLNHQQLTELKENCSHYGIAIEVGTKGVEPGHLLQYLDIANKLGSKSIRTLTHSNENRPNLSMVESWVKQVIPSFEQAGVTLAVENYESFSVKEFAGLIEEVGSEFFGICLDTVNSMGALESPQEVVKTLAPHVKNLHIKEFAITRVANGMGFHIGGRPVGDGMLNVRMILEEIEKAGKAPTVILEQWPPFLETIDETMELEMEWAQQSINYLKEIM